MRAVKKILKITFAKKECYGYINKIMLRVLLKNSTKTLEVRK